MALDGNDDRRVRGPRSVSSKAGMRPWRTRAARGPARRPPLGPGAVHLDCGSDPIGCRCEPRRSAAWRLPCRRSTGHGMSNAGVRTTRQGPADQQVAPERLRQAREAMPPEPAPRRPVEPWRGAAGIRQPTVRGSRRNGSRVLPDLLRPQRARDFAHRGAGLRADPGARGGARDVGSPGPSPAPAELRHGSRLVRVEV